MIAARVEVISNFWDRFLSHAHDEDKRFCTNSHFLIYKMLTKLEVKTKCDTCKKKINPIEGFYTCAQKCGQNYHKHCCDHLKDQDDDIMKSLLKRVIYVPDEVRHAALRYYIKKC